MQDAKVAFVCDCPFPNQDKKHVHGQRHRLLSCLYYLEVKEIENVAHLARKRKKEEDAESAHLKKGRK